MTEVIQYIDIHSHIIYGADDGAVNSPDIRNIIAYICLPCGRSRK